MSQSMTAMPATMPALAANGATKLSNSWIHVANTSVAIGSAWGNRAIRLAGRRLARNRAAVERLSHCASWQDLLELQMTWAKDVMQDYFDESREFLSLVQKAANAPAEVVEASDQPAGERPATNGETPTEGEAPAAGEHFAA